MSAEIMFGSNGAIDHGPQGTLTARDDSRMVANVPTLEELERVHIRFVLERVQWHQGRAAEVLGISSKTLYRKIRQYGFKRPHIPSNIR